MPSQRGDARSFETAHSSSYHHHLAASPLRRIDLMCDPGFASSRRVVNTRGLVRPAEGCADTGPNAILFALDQLFHNMRIGDMRTRHADQVEHVFRYRVARTGKVG